jgi:hypothetical protein
MSQLALLTWTPPQPKPSASVQAREVARVEKGIALDVIEFCRTHATFRADELRAYVVAKGGRAPGSPDRILRQLRVRGVVSYRVLDRRASLYEIRSVRT